MIPICSSEDMYADIIEAGVIPFFSSGIPGFSIADLTPREHWFAYSDDLGPWDWKIFAVQSGDIAYGKFLSRGKSAFATVDCFRHVMNWRRSRPAKPFPEGDRVMEFVKENGSCTTADVRRILGLKKGPADAVIAKLQYRTLLVTGDIERVYRGEDLHYSGWQHATFCRPDDLFETGPAECSPEESYRLLSERIGSVAPEANEKNISVLLG